MGEVLCGASTEIVLFCYLLAIITLNELRTLEVYVRALFHLNRIFKLRDTYMTSWLLVPKWFQLVLTGMF